MVLFFHYMNKLIIFCMLVTISCKEHKTSYEHPNNSATNELEFITKGIVKEFLDNGMIKIEHEEIPNYMPSMTMPFNIKNKAEADGIKIGDKISFKFNVGEDYSWINEIVILNATPDNENKEYKTGTDSEKRYLTIGDVIGNYDFINHKNEKVSLSHFNDKVLVMSFIYTRCPVPDFCPQLSLKFKSTLESLSTELPNQNGYHFLSITFDPEHDTPNVLNNYAKLYEASNHNNWSFLTSSTEEIQKFTDKIGLVISREKESILDWDHNLRTLVTNQSGMIKTILIGNLWSADELVNEIKELL